MNDTVYLLVDGKLIEHFESYTIDADLYTAEDSFSMTLSDPEAPVKEDMQVELYVNDKLELTGVIDSAEETGDKDGGSRLAITGRDLMGQVMAQNVDEFIDLQEYTLKALAEKLLATVPFINRASVKYHENAANTQGRLKASAMQVGIFDTTMSFSRIEPGMKVGEVLMEYAKSRGLLFFAMPDGTFVFGIPAAGGMAAFSLTVTKDGIQEATSWSKKEDNSKRYKTVKVIGQKQGTVLSSATDVNVIGTDTDPDFSIDRTYVHKDEYGGDSPDLTAAMLLQKMRHDSHRLTFKVPGHSQNGRNWSINELCTVNATVFKNPVIGARLIYGRTFTMSKTEGTGTALRMGYPGLMV